MTADGKAKYICHACIGDPYLSLEVRREWTPATCGYCGGTREALAQEDLADRIHGVLHEHFQLTPNYPDEPHEYFLLSEGRWERRGDPVSFVIAEIAGLDEPLADDLTELLSEQHNYRTAKGDGENPYGREAMYEEREPFDFGFQLTWAELCRHIRSRSRFFSEDAERMLSEIFGDLSAHWLGSTWPHGIKAARESSRCSRSHRCALETGCALPRSRPWSISHRRISWTAHHRELRKR